jgi:para-nitrobenzyl esterase
LKNHNLETDEKGGTVMSKTRRPNYRIGVSALFTVFLCGAQALAGGGTICPEPVQTTEGLVKGFSETEYGACVWRGIPYAAPPVRELRWQRPYPPDSHEGIFNAYNFGPSCPQNEVIFSGGESEAFSEDCLTLNIFSPQKSGKFPVMFWIHGGAFIIGAGTYDMYQGARLATEKDIVVVTINYRLGALGFFALPELAAEDPDGSTGNYGLMDQIQALKWVQNNIAGFNGDPDNVTIFGQSAGGMSVCALLASPQAAGLFHRAIPMSGSCAIAGSLEKKYEDYQQFARDLGCEGEDVLDCLRQKPAEAFVPQGGLLSAIRNIDEIMSHLPLIDGYVLTDQPIDCIREGNYNQVPVMIGGTRDEIKFFTMILPGMSLVPRFAVNKLINWMFDEKTDELMEMYSYSDYKHPAQLFLAVANDAFGAQSYVAAEALSERTPVYLYRFDWDETRFPDKAGAFHALDVPFVFGKEHPDARIARWLNKKHDYSRAALGGQIMDYYTNFAKTGDPNGAGLPDWPAYTTEKRDRIYFDNPITAAPLTEKELERYRFFSEYGLGDLLGK